jgi:hypothetical protein
VIAAGDGSEPRTGLGGGTGSGAEPSPSLEALDPGQSCSISEARWFARLETCEPLHQWASCFLVAEGRDDLRIYFRDPSGGGGHRAGRLDAPRAARAREGLGALEQASDLVADLIRAEQDRGRSTLDQRREQDAASQDYVHQGDALYAELLGIFGS